MPTHKAPEGETVHHVKHYNDHPGNIECIEVIRWMTWNIGTAVKYLWRAGLKPGEALEKDLKKAIWYIQDEIARNRGLHVTGDMVREEMAKDFLSTGARLEATEEFLASIQSTKSNALRPASVGCGGDVYLSRKCDCPCHKSCMACEFCTKTP